MSFLAGLRKKKIYILMHKDIPVLEAVYDRETSRFTEIREILHYEHVPYSARKENEEISLKRLNHWFRWRGIPGYRVGLNTLLGRLGVKDPEELLNEYYALSVSDHYWLVESEEKKDLSYEDVSFFRHSFDQNGFGRAMFSLGRAEIQESAKKTPNNVLAGYQKKSWFRQNGDLYLYKGGTFPYQLEPVHEKLAAEIGRRLGMDFVDYNTTVYENQVVSVCRNMLDENSELITADEVLSLKKPVKDQFDYYSYIDILKEKGIADPEKLMDDMLVLDFLMMNTDRHNQNLGVIIDPDTMEWKKIAPIFDTGTGLACLRKNEEVKQWPEIYNYRLFNSNKILDNIVCYLIDDIGRYDLSVLDESLLDFYREAMMKHRAVSGIQQERIDSQTELLAKRIREFKRLQQKACR